MANLKPHKIQDTLSINEARRLILCLTKLLLGVTKDFNDIKRRLDNNWEQLRDENRSCHDLRKRLHFRVKRVRQQNIDHPMTVCTHQRCLDVHIVSTEYLLDCFPK